MSDRILQIRHARFGESCGRCYRPIVVGEMVATVKGTMGLQDVCDRHFDVPQADTTESHGNGE